MSKLESILQEEVLREIEKILAEAEQKAEALLSQARAQAERVVAQAERRLEAERRAELNRAESAAELKITTARMRAKGEVIARVREKATERIQGFDRDPAWPEVLVKLANEALAAVPDPDRVEASAEDVKRLEGWAKAKGVVLEANPEVRLGVRVWGKSANTFVENTLPARLERGWDELAARVAEFLWG